MSAPKTLLPYDRHWPGRFCGEAERLSAALGAGLVLHHIGSTAVPGLLAKPIIDMLGEVSDLAMVDEMTPVLVDLGYAAKGAYGIEGRRYFRRETQGQRSHHLHIFETGATPAWAHLAQRDFLRAHPREVLGYAAAKQQAWKAAGPDGYQKAKAAYVDALARRACDWAARRQIVSSHNDATGQLCVDIGRDENGFTWAECRRDAEDSHGWRATGQGGRGYQTADAALAAAQGCCPWISG